MFLTFACGIDLVLRFCSNALARWLIWRLMAHLGTRRNVMLLLWLWFLSLSIVAVSAGVVVAARCYVRQGGNVFRLVRVCLSVSVCVQHNSRRHRWIVMIFGVWVGCHQTRKRLDFGLSSGWPWYCRGTSGFCISCSEHATVMIFSGRKLVGKERSCVSLGLLATIIGTAAAFLFKTLKANNSGLIR